MPKEDILQKLVQVLKTLLDPDAEISDDNVTRLVKCITGIPDDVIDKNDIHSLLQNWLSNAVNIWEKSPPHPEVLTLALNFAVFLLSEEHIFIEMMEQNITERFIKILKKSLQRMGATPDIGYVRLMSCFLKHKTGSKWMVATNYWPEILSMTINSEENSYFIEEKSKFIHKLVLDSLEIDSQLASKIIYHLILPTIEFSDVVSKKNNFSDNLFMLNCFPKLNILENFFLTCLNVKKEKIFQMFDIILAISNQSGFEERAINICLHSSNESIKVKLISIIIYLKHLELICKAKNIPQMENKDFFWFIEEAEYFKRKLHEEFQKLFPKIGFNLIKFYKNIKNWLPKMRLKDGSIVELLTSLICFQHAPIFTLTNFFTENGTSDFEKDVIRQKYVLDRLKELPPTAFYHLYQTRDYVQDHFSFDYLIMSIEFILKSLSHYTREQAKKSLVCFIYGLEDFFELLPKNNEELLTSVAAMKYLASLIEAVKVIIKMFNFKWSDSFETVTLMETILSIFEIPGVGSNVIVNGLELISVAFSQQLSIGLAFLLDKLDGDLIERIIEFCTLKMEKENSEVKVAAIKVIESVTNIVTKDFSSFQSLILEKDLPVKILKFSMQDKDPHVRGSSIRCLQEMSKVTEIWDSLKQQYDIYNLICQIIYNDCNHLVRGEVTTLIAIVYEQHDLSKETLMIFYDTISNVITEETSSVVKKSSLEFWKKVIQKHLTIEGMIDGQFPEFTFSRESRKIIALTEHEIKRRLIKILHSLSACGCLSVLKTALQDCDIIVNEGAEDIVIEFHELLERFNVKSFDFERNNTINFKDSFPDISVSLKGRQILHPELYLEYVENYIKTNKSTADDCQEYLIETVLNDIVR